jgi:hypothetical protein
VETKTPPRSAAWTPLRLGKSLPAAQAGAEHSLQGSTWTIATARRLLCRSPSSASLATFCSARCRPLCCGTCLYSHCHQQATRGCRDGRRGSLWLPTRVCVHFIVWASSQATRLHRNAGMIQVHSVILDKALGPGVQVNSSLERWVAVMMRLVHCFSTNALAALIALT